MVREVVDGNGELVIALMREGLEFKQTGISAVYSIACLAKIETCEELEDGKFKHCRDRIAACTPGSDRSQFSISAGGS